MNRQPYEGSASSAMSPSLVWRDMVESIRVLTACASWRAAHSFADPLIRQNWGRRDAPAEFYELLGLYLLSCVRLDYVQLIEQAGDWIEGLLEDGCRLNSEGRNLLCFHAARRQADRGDYQRAHEIVTDTETNSSSASTGALLASLMARILARQGELPAALDSALRACRLAKLCDSPSLEADCYVALANVLSLKRDFDSAQRSLARAARCYWRGSDSAGRAICLINRASQLLFLGRLVEAEGILKEAIQLAHDVGRPHSSLCARIAAGWLSGLKGDTVSARRHLLWSWREARRRKAPREEALALGLLADAYLQVGIQRRSFVRATIAVRLLERLVVALGRQGDLALELSLRKAKLSLCAGDYQECLDEAEGIIDSACSQGLAWEQAFGLRLQGTAHYYLGNRSEAISAMERAAVLLDGIGERLDIQLVRRWLSILTNTTILGETLGNALPIWLSAYLRHPVFAPPLRTGSFGGVVKGKDCVQLDCQVDDEACYWKKAGLISRDCLVHQLLSLAETYAPENIPVLLLGETGTGKDLLARGIHDLSGRKGHYVPVNCAAAQKHLFAAELFGARKGAYTGASENREGLIREADKGTLFFDEIADLDAEAQGFLLRFLDSGEVRPLGSTKWTHVDVRIVAATCRDLKRLVAESRFRPDLYARLAAVVLRVPPLRERKEDLVPLLGMFWKRLGGNDEEYETLFTRDMLDHLKQYPWPGNVRALRHLVALAIPLLRSQGPVKTRLHLIQWADQECLVRNREVDYTESGVIAQPSYRGLTSDDNGTLPARIPSEKLNGQVSRWPVELLLNTLRAANGRVPDAALVLGVSRSQAYRIYKSVRALTQES